MKIGEDLPDLTFKADDGLAHAFAALDCYAGVGEFGLVEVENGFEEMGGADSEGVAGLLVETEGLGGDLRGAVELVLCLNDVGAGLLEVV